MIKTRLAYLSMLVAAVLLVGGGCASTEPAPTTGEPEKSAMEESGESMEETKGEDVTEEASADMETYDHKSGAYSYTFDPAKYDTTPYVSSDSVSLDDISGENKKTALQVFVRVEGDDKLTDELKEKATSATPEFVKPFGTMSVYAAKASTGEVLEIRCQKKNCEEVLPMLTVN